MGHVCLEFVSPQSGAGIASYDVAVGVPTFLFLGFLAWNIKPALRKLQRSSSHIMATYYGLLWAITTLNLVRCILQMTQSSIHQGMVWNVLWIITRFGMVSMEASVVVYLLQGYVMSGRQALLQTSVISGGAALVDAVIKILYIFAFHIQLYLYDATGDMRWSKWSFWFMHSLLAVLCYTAILVLPFTPWRDILPAKASFYRYALCLLLGYLTMGVGSLLIGAKVAAGYCVYGSAMWLYYAAYPALVYLTFLAEFFSDEQLDIDMMYYSEMRDAGCFDDAYGNTLS